MINLLQKQEKKELVRSFYFRFVVVAFFLLGVVLVLATIAILPSYFFSISEKNTANANLEKQKSEVTPVIDQKTEGTIAEINNKLSLIEKAEKGKFIVSEKIVNEVMLRKMSDIKINKLSYQGEGAKGRTIQIDGTAPGRERLRAFYEALREDSNFKNVNLPISNFIKGTDIKFSLSLEPA